MRPTAIRNQKEFDDRVDTMVSAATLGGELNSILKSLARDVQSLRFNKSHPPHLFVVMLYGSLLEFFEASIRIINARAFVALPIMARSMFEAHIHLRNAISDKDYARILYANSLDQNVKILKYARANPQSPTLKDIGGSPELEEVIEERVAQLEKLATQGHRPISIFESAKRANLTDEYRSIYALLCQDAHHDMRALERPHLSKAVSGEIEVDLFKDHPIEDLLPEIISMVRIVFDSGLRTKRYLESPAVELPIEVTNAVSSFAERYGGLAIKYQEERTSSRED